jgi:hypothetical protein
MTRIAVPVEHVNLIARVSNASDARAGGRASNASQTGVDAGELRQIASRS